MNGLELQVDCGDALSAHGWIDVDSNSAFNIKEMKRCKDKNLASSTGLSRCEIVAFDRQETAN